jgi:hypothetical protein
MLRYVGADEARSSLPRSPIGGMDPRAFHRGSPDKGTGVYDGPGGWSVSRLGTMPALGAARRKPSPARWAILVAAERVLTVLVVRANRLEGPIGIRGKREGRSPSPPVMVASPL